ncbi:MAG: DUF302 domain-containing protein [Gammaproteobacteria bacterium]
MKSIAHMFGFVLAASGVLLGDAALAAQDDLFIVKSSQKAPQDVVAAIKSYAEQKKWIYLGSNKVKEGEVTLVKVCIRAAGKYVWAAGMEYSAMLPCGNLSLYKKDGMTQISLLNPDFMNRLHPDPNLKKLGEETLPQFEAMLTTVVK